MKVVCCWTDISGYMAACWRALASEADIDFHLIAYALDPQATHINFDEGLLEGLSYDLIDTTRQDDAAWLTNRVASLEPDVVILPGWLNRAYRKIAYDPRLQKTAFVMSMDTPWRGTARQHIARFALSGYLKHIDHVMACGERAWQYARQLGFQEGQISIGNYGFDFSAMNAAAAERDAENWPRRFLFVGRYIPAKGLDTLISGYQRYRQQVDEPWSLTCCGTGPLQQTLVDCEGIEDYGFVQPSDLPKVFAEHGAFVLTSRYEPWGVVLAEAAAAGLPIVCNHSCGASVEMVRPYFNGLTIATRDVEALSDAMLWIHENESQLATMGQRSQTFAAAFSPAIWVKRWKAAFDASLLRKSSSHLPT